MSEELPQLSPEEWEAFDKLPPQLKWFMTHVLPVMPVATVLELYEDKVAGGMNTLRADQETLAALKNLLQTKGHLNDLRPCEKKGSKHARPPTYIGSSSRALERDGWEMG